MDYNARFYSPRLGRFTQPDSIVPGLGSQASNRYSYVENSPLNLADPSGHKAEGSCGYNDTCPDDPVPPPPPIPPDDGTPPDASDPPEEDTGDDDKNDRDDIPYCNDTSAYSRGAYYPCEEFKLTMDLPAETIIFTYIEDGSSSVAKITIAVSMIIDYNQEYTDVYLEIYWEDLYYDLPVFVTANVFGPKSTAPGVPPELLGIIADQITLDGSSGTAVISGAVARSSFIPDPSEMSILISFMPSLTKNNISAPNDFLYEFNDHMNYYKN